MNEPACPDLNDLAAFLEERASAAVEEHVAACPACAGQLRELEELRHALPAPVPAALEKRARSLVPGRRRWVAPAWAALAAVAVALSYASYRLGEEAFFAAEVSLFEGEDR